MAVKNVYEMMRDRAKDMGHAAAKLPAAAWEKQLQMNDKKQTLLSAKLYMENYMMGEIEPAEFAQLMAGDDSLRYTISDLCRVRLEPSGLDIEEIARERYYNGKYVDVGAGVKTFWSEIRVPLPSEVQAARDMRNINLGIEAERNLSGKAVENAPAGEVQAPEENKKRSFRDILNSAKQRAAEAAIEKLKPIAEGRKEEVKDEAWLETDEGREYKDSYTRNVAQQVENVVMAIEAGKEETLEPAEREKAFEAAGMEPEQAQAEVREDLRSGYTEEQLNATVDEDLSRLFDEAADDQAAEPVELRSGYTAEELNAPMSNEMQVLMDQMAQHVDRGTSEKQDKGQKREKGQGRKRDDRAYGSFEGKDVSFKNSWSTHKFTDEEVEKLFAGETINFQYENKEGQMKDASGKLEWQEYEGRKFLGFKAEFGKKQEASDEISTTQGEQVVQAGMTEADMNDYYNRLAQGLGDYQPDEDPSYEEGEQPELTEEDLANLFGDQQGMQV